MGKASRRKRLGDAAVDVGPAVGATRQAAVPAGQRRAAAGGPRSAAAANARRAPETATTRLASMLGRWDVWLAALAAACWLLGHVPDFAPLANPAWVLTGLALGLLSPWLGLLLGVALVPFLGGAVDFQSGEPLRVIPILGAAVRVLLDRSFLDAALGRARRAGPPWWTVLAAVAAAALYAYTTSTAATAVGDPGYVPAGLHWLAGGPIAMMAAWVAASHLVAGRDDTLADVVLATLVVGCTLALVAYVGVPGASLITFPGIINGRLAALGYPTPTGMGIATALPFAVWAAWRQARWLAFAVIGLALVTIILTWSRGPLIAIGVGSVLAVLASGRVERRMKLAGLVVGAVAVVGLAFARYGADPSQAIQRFLDQVAGSDVDRVNTWVAAVSITIANPLVGGGWRSLERFGTFAQHQIAYSHDILLHGFAEGGLPLGIANATPILYSAWCVWRRRHTMAPYLIAAAVTFLVCGFWDIPQVRSYAAVMGGVALGMAAGPLIGRREAVDAPVARG